MANRGRKVVRVLLGVVLMAAFVLVALGILSRYAGGWGVPYFSFTTERGSHCENGLTGYTCTGLTIEDVQYWGDIELPAGSGVESGTYHQTHDYQLDAVVDVPAAGAAEALKSLQQAFGKCLADHPSPLRTGGLSEVCVLANDDAVVSSGEPTSRLYTIGTALRRDGTRVIAFAIHSR